MTLNWGKTTDGIHVAQGRTHHYQITRDDGLYIPTADGKLIPKSRPSKSPGHEVLQAAKRMCERVESIPDSEAELSWMSVERIQTGVRLEKRMLKVLKALAEYNDQSLGELLEEIVLHSLDGAQAFGPQSLERIKQLKEVYGMDYDSHASYRFAESA